MNTEYVLFAVTMVTWTHTNWDVRIAAVGWFPKCNQRALQISAFSAEQISAPPINGAIFFSAFLGGDNQGIKLHQAS